jgi:hypothetical protein
MPFAFAGRGGIEMRALAFVPFVVVGLSCLGAPSDPAPDVSAHEEAVTADPDGSCSCPSLLGEGCILVANWCNKGPVTRAECTMSPECEYWCCDVDEGDLGLPIEQWHVGDCWDYTQACSWSGRDTAPPPLGV